MKKMMENEDCPERWLDKILVYTVVATIIGARLGHVFFYDWDYYSKNLMEIPMVWKGGLASHGAAIAIIFAIWMYSKRVTKKSVFWALDKVVVTVAIAACFIRIGNLMNSEIIGHKSESSNAFFFQYINFFLFRPSRGPRLTDPVCPFLGCAMLPKLLFLKNNHSIEKIEKAIGKLIEFD